MVTEEITLEGHIVDSLILSKVLDEILAGDGGFRLIDVNIGQHRDDRSFARIEVSAETQDGLTRLLEKLSKHGAILQTSGDVMLQPAEKTGVFPEAFYSTTNQKTLVRHGGTWKEVHNQEMDCGIRYDEADDRFSCVPMSDVQKGDPIVVGHRGTKVIPFDQPEKSEGFGFMSSAVSTEKPKSVLIHRAARQMMQARESGEKILLVGGPAIVHTGSASHIVKLIEAGYVQTLFAGNALAAHDIEQALYGTSLGICLDRATPTDAGHEHHLRAINTIRRHGSIRAAVEAGTLGSGIMHACVKRNVDVLLAGSIRDDGPLPDVITDTLVAQQAMRQRLADTGFVLMIATALHAIATGNLLPAWVPVVCVDIQPTVVTKLADRGSFQTVGVVTDVEPFLRELLNELNL